LSQRRQGPELKFSVKHLMRWTNMLGHHKATFCCIHFDVLDCNAYMQ
jgi:hypothetical protein